MSRLDALSTESQTELIRAITGRTIEGCTITPQAHHNRSTVVLSLDDGRKLQFTIRPVKDFVLIAQDDKPQNQVFGFGGDDLSGPGTLGG